jgi:hypothetical protein
MRRRTCGLRARRSTAGRAVEPLLAGRPTAMGMAAMFCVSVVTAVLSACQCCGSTDGAVTIYVDAASGDDRSDGRSPETAWRSVERANRHRFRPGSTLLFKAGTAYTGRLHPRGSGSEDSPIVISSYGDGPAPRIDAEGRYGEALLLDNQQYWEVSNLELTNYGEERERYRYGVRITAANYGVMHHIYLSNLYIHDVNGTLRKEDRAEGHGIYYENLGPIASRFDDLRIENCRLEHIDRNGIGGHTRFRTYRDVKNTNVVIRGNELYDIGGDGIKVSGCDGAIVERNLVRMAGQGREGPSCGIWPFSTTNSLFQHNEVCYTGGTWDGQGFDSDNDCRNNVFQFNYSHDNEGGFFLICTRYRSRNNIGNQGTIIRYNISQNDRMRTFLVGGPVEDLQIYNNVIYIGKDLDVKMLHFAPRMDRQEENVLWGSGILFFNNIVLSEGTARVTYNRTPMAADGTYQGVTGVGMGEVSFRSNVFFGRFLPGFRPGNLVEDPLLVDPGSGGEGLGTLGGYLLSTESPCADGGIAVPRDVDRDFWGNPVPAGSAPDIGAHELR